MRARTLLLGGLLAFIAGIAANQQFGIRKAPIDSFERAVQQIIEH